jgi:hypothetical protein
MLLQEKIKRSKIKWQINVIITFYIVMLI